MDWYGNLDLRCKVTVDFVLDSKCSKFSIVFYSFLVFRRRGSRGWSRQVQFLCRMVYFSTSMMFTYFWFSWVLVICAAMMYTVKLVDFRAFARALPVFFHAIWTDTMSMSVDDATCNRSLYIVNDFSWCSSLALQNFCQATSTSKIYDDLNMELTAGIPCLFQETGTGDNREGLGDLSPLSPKSEGTGPCATTLTDETWSIFPGIATKLVIRLILLTVTTY